MRALIVVGFLVVAGCARAGDLPNSKLTPGAATSETKEQICAKSFHTRDERFVTAAEKKQVYVEYKQDPKAKPCPCEVDHLISLELGGSNDIKNLWPQSYTTKPNNAHVKDQLENHLHKLVCSNKVTLKDAQDAISHDWIATYKKYMGMK